MKLGPCTNAEPEASRTKRRLEEGLPGRKGASKVRGDVPARQSLVFPTQNMAADGTVRVASAREGHVRVGRVTCSCSCHG